MCYFLRIDVILCKTKANNMLNAIADEINSIGRNFSISMEGRRAHIAPCTKYISKEISPKKFKCPVCLSSAKVRFFVNKTKISVEK